MQMETNRIEDSNIRQMFITIISTHQFSSKSITNCLYIWHMYFVEFDARNQTRL